MSQIYPKSPQDHASLHRVVTLPIHAVIKLEWAVIKSKLGSVKKFIFKMSEHVQLIAVSHYPQYERIKTFLIKKDTEMIVTQI